MRTLTTGLLAFSSTAGARYTFLALSFLLLFSTPSPTQAVDPSFDELSRKADAARQANQPSAAIGLYTQALAIHPEWSEGWWSLATLQYQTAAFADGRDSLNHFIALQPQSGPGFAVRGLCEFETSEYNQSLADLQKGLALQAASDPRIERVLRFHLAQLLALKGNFEAALHEYVFFARSNVTDQDVLTGIGLAGLRIPVLPKNLRADLRQLALDTGSATAHSLAGDENNAEQQFKELFARYPNAENLHFLRGYLLFENDPGQAVEEFKLELDSHPANASADMMLSWGLLLLNNPTGALPYAEKATAAEPASPVAQLVLGRALVETGSARAGLEHLQAALKLDPNNLEIHLALVKAYSELGSKQEAQQERTLCLALTRNEAPLDRP